MNLRISPVPVLEGEIEVPGDKSISHRALLLNALARGRAQVRNLGPGADVQATRRCLEALGVRVEADNGVMVVEGVGGAFREPEDVLDAGNSGTTLRLLAGVLAAQPFLSLITGDASLRSRPMGRIVEPLRLMGAQLWGRKGDSLPPLAIRGGALRGIKYPLPIPSAQVKSAILLAGLFASGRTEVEEPLPSRDHTERLLSRMGVPVERQGSRVALSALSSPLAPLDLTVPGDLSSAAYFLVAGLVHPRARLRVRGVGVNPTRSGLLDALKEMGARLSLENLREEGGEPVADLVVESSQLQAISLGAETIPRLIDEVPVLAVAATQARGTTTIRGAEELRVKESDRLAGMARGLSLMGARVEELPDGLAIHGPTPLQGARVDSQGDHRLAMALGVAALLAQGETLIERAEAVDISYPGFFYVLKGLGASSLARRQE